MLLAERAARAQVDIDAEIALVHNFMRDHYRAKFPELESLVHHAVDYARVVSAIGNEMDLTLVDLEDILPQARPWKRARACLTKSACDMDGAPCAVFPAQLRRRHNGFTLRLGPCVHSQTVAWGSGTAYAPASKSRKGRFDCNGIIMRVYSFRWWDARVQATIMVVSVTASTTSGKPLSAEELAMVRPAALASFASMPG